MNLNLSEFERLYDFLKRGDLVGDITDDGCPESAFDVAKSLLLNSIVCMPSKETVIIFKKINFVLAELHFITTEKDKKNLYKNTVKTASWIGDNTNIKTIIAFIPIDRGSVIHCANKAGLVYLGMVKNGFQKDNRMFDMVILSGSIKDIGTEAKKWLEP